MSSLAKDIRLLALRMEKETHGITRDFTADMLDLANRAEREEKNLTFLVSCMAASADELGERKSTPAHQINRHHGLMELASRALAGFAVWRHEPDRQSTLDRVERVRALLAPRVKKIEQ